MRIITPDGEFYKGEELTNRLAEVYHRSGVGLVNMTELLGCNYNTANAYVNKYRFIVNEETARRAEFAIKLLNDMCDENILPIDSPKKSRFTSQRVMLKINEYLETYEP